MPWVHYVPLRADLSDLEERLEVVLRNSTRLYQIASNAAALAMRHLSRRGQLCHWAALLRELSLHMGQMRHDPTCPRVAHHGTALEL